MSKGIHLCGCSYLLYHGSENIIEAPFLGGGKKNNDYGQGLYCTKDIELAREWACAECISAYVNIYELDIENLKVLDLSKEKFSTLNWLALLVNNQITFWKSNMLNF